MGRMPSQPDPHTNLLTKQIEQLQERYRMLGEEAARELESMKSQVIEHQSEERKNLEDQIGLLRNTIFQLESEKQQTEDEFHKFKILIEDKSRALHHHIKSFSLEALNNLEAMLDAAEKTPVLGAKTGESKKPQPVQEPVQEPVSVAALATTFNEVQPQDKLSEVKPRTIHKVHKHTKRLVKHMVLYPGMLALLALGGWKSYLYIVPRNETGQVAGASTSAPAKPAPGEAANSYPESFVDLPFSQTVWENSSDSEFGVSFQYPKNTSNRVKLIGGNNIWVLRKNGYLLKISRIETTQKLDDWWNDSKSEYEQGAPATKTTFKNLPAWKLPSQDPAGSTYFVKNDKAILQVWVQDGITDKDDAQRVQKIIDSIQFTKPS